MLENLDRLCAEYGEKFAREIAGAFGSKDKDKKAENLITKSLGVLQEQGIYAYVLFNESRGQSEKNAGNKMNELTKELLKDKLLLIGEGDLLKEIRKDEGLAADLEKLILAMQVLQQTLTYARYHAKAMAPDNQQADAEGGTS